jgi:hypothetical protein
VESQQRALKEKYDDIQNEIRNSIERADQVHCPAPQERSTSSLRPCIYQHGLAARLEPATLIPPPTPFRQSDT